MKRLFAMLLALLCLLALTAQAEGLPTLDENALATPTPTPEPLDPLPDPGESLGWSGILYAEDYTYDDLTYNTYLYAQPEDVAAFTEAYTEAVQAAGAAALRESLRKARGSSIAGGLLLLLRLLLVGGAY